MKCHKEVDLWKGVDTEAKLQEILPPPWRIMRFVDFDQAKKMGGDVRAYAFCAVPTDVDTPCEDLWQSFYDAIDEAKSPDDGEAGHVGETARTYGRGSRR